MVLIVNVSMTVAKRFVVVVMDVFCSRIGVRTVFVDMVPIQVMVPMRVPDRLVDVLVPVAIDR